MILIAEPNVDDGIAVGRDVPGFGKLVEIGQDFSRFGLFPGDCVRVSEPCQVWDGFSTEAHRLSERVDGFSKRPLLLIRQTNVKPRQGVAVIHRDGLLQLFDGLVVLPRDQIMPPEMGIHRQGTWVRV